MRLTTSPRTQSLDPLHNAPTTSTYFSPPQFSLGKWQGFAMEENRNSLSNSQCGSKILGQRGNTKMGRVSMISCFSLEWGPNTLFYRPKEIVTFEVTGYRWSNG